jgi:nitrogen fixation protein FixH
VSVPRIHWGAGVAIVYVAFAASTSAFVAFALRHPVELVTADYYEQSLQHDARLDAVARTRALLQPIRVELDAAAGDVRLVLPAEAAAAGATGTITFYRPADARADRVLPLALAPDGVQRVPLAGLAPGRWLVRVAWRAGGLDYFHEQPVVRP